MKIILFHLEIFEVRRPKYKKEKALIRQGFPKMRSPFFDKNVRKTDFVQPADSSSALPYNMCPRIILRQSEYLPLKKG